MKSTCRDFWKMVYERECGVIVMLSDLTENGEVGSMLYILIIRCIHTVVYLIHCRRSVISTGPTLAACLHRSMGNTPSQLLKKRTEMTLCSESLMLLIPR